MDEPIDITTEAAAIEKANRITGFEQFTGEATARRIEVPSSNLPFLARELSGKPAWQVDFGAFHIRLKSAMRGFGDQYDRLFRLVLLEEKGRIAGIESRYEGPPEEMRAPASAESAERQLRGSAEVYTGFPPRDPEIDFLRALDIVLSKGSGSPFLAKAIEGVYVMESSMGAAPRAVWAVTLLGLPPFSAHGPQADRVPVWQRNHMRNVIDASTGEFLFATTSPQPV